MHTHKQSGRWHDVLDADKSKLHINQDKRQQPSMSQNNKKREYRAYPAIVQTAYMDA
jgi:hypothetical protein